MPVTTEGAERAHRPDPASTLTDEPARHPDHRAHDAVDAGLVLARSPVVVRPRSTWLFTVASGPRARAIEARAGPDFADSS